MRSSNDHMKLKVQFVQRSLAVRGTGVFAVPRHNAILNVNQLYYPFARSVP
jgi:hypothetical protein